MATALFISFALVAGCGGSEREAAAIEPSPTTEAPPPTTPASTPPEGVLCLPIVHGCGCAYQCALGEPREDGRYDVTHAGQDSRIDVAVVERRCFDADGRAFYESDRPPGARCQDVFYDQTPCGGECVPTTAFLDCELSAGRCAAPESLR